MKVSINLIRYYRSLYNWSEDPAPEGVERLVEKIGAQLGAVEETIAIGNKYDGVVVVHVVSCEQHPNADRLKVCMIDDGGVVEGVPRDDKGLVQVVCGAPNVEAGVTVVWLPPGSTVPSTYANDPFVLEARELRGVVSNGMLASPKELALGDSHEGILVIAEEVPAGTWFADKYGFRDDIIIDIENKMFTHRPDCFGMIGVAREIAGIQGQSFQSPDWYRSNAQIAAASDEQLKLEVRNEIPELVPRFCAVPMSNITVTSSPVWLQAELSRLGIRPINNVVDLTNYYMLLTGQPLHAYDYDKVKAQDADAEKATLVIRQPRPQEKLMLLNGKEIEPRSEAIMIATNEKPIGLGGVMGGADTEVDNNTKNIILECATFDMYSIRRTSMAHGIFSDAVTRFTKGQSPLQNMAVLAKIVDDIQRICGGKVAGSTVDDDHLPHDVQERNSLHPDVVVDTAFINARLGLRLSLDQVAELLKNVEFSVRTENESMIVRAPFWRTDIAIPEDIVEEVGRLHGFDKLPLELPSRSIEPAVKDILLEAKADLRFRLSRAGAHEVLSYSFVHGNLLEKAGQDTAQAFKLSNALSPDLQYYRLSLTPSLLDKVHINVKAGYEEFGLFELGKVHGKSEVDEDGLPKEFGRLGYVFAAAPKKAEQQYAGAAYFTAAKYLRSILPEDVHAYSFRPLSEVNFKEHELFDQMIKPFEPGRSAVVFNGDRLIGIVGEYAVAVQQAFKLPRFCAGFEVFLSPFADKLGSSISYKALPRFPRITQDITLKVNSEVTYGQLYDLARQELARRSGDELHASLSPLDIYQSESDTGHKQITFRLAVASYTRTLTDPEAAVILEAIAVSASAKLGTERV